MIVAIDASTERWKRIRQFGGLMLFGGLALTVLTLTIQGRGAVVIDSFIVFGPFLLTFGTAIYVWAAIAAWRDKSRR